MGHTTYSKGIKQDIAMYREDTIYLSVENLDSTSHEEVTMYFLEEMLGSMPQVDQIMY